MPNASAASEAQQWQWERCRWLHVAPCTCEVSREWCVWVQPALNARIHFSPRFKSTFTTFDSDISFLYLANPSQSHSSPLIKPAQRSGLSDHFHGLTGPFPCCTLGRLLVACVPSARSKWLLRGSDALDELLCLRRYTPQPSTSMGLEVSDTERMRARIGPAHSFSPPCSAHATDPCSRA